MFEVSELFELSPYKIGLFYFISESAPRPSRYESTNHTWIIAFAYVYFNLSLIVQRYLYKPAIGVIGFPYEITIGIGLEWYYKPLSLILKLFLFGLDSTLSFVEGSEQILPYESVGLQLECLYSLLIIDVFHWDGVFESGGVTVEEKYRLLTHNLLLQVLNVLITQIVLHVASCLDEETCWLLYLLRIHQL